MKTRLEHELELYVWGPFFGEDHCYPGGGETCQGCGERVERVRSVDGPPKVGDVFMCSDCGVEHVLLADGFRRRDQ